MGLHVFVNIIRTNYHQISMAYHFLHSNMTLLTWPALSISPQTLPHTIQFNHPGILLIPTDWSGKCTRLTTCQTMAFISPLSIIQLSRWFRSFQGLIWYVTLRSSTRDLSTMTTHHCRLGHAMQAWRHMVVPPLQYSSSNDTTFTRIYEVKHDKNSGKYHVFMLLCAVNQRCQTISLVHCNLHVFHIFISPELIVFVHG